MKNNKKLLGLILGLVCVLICLALVLTMCKNNADDPQNATTAETTEDSGTEATNSVGNESTQPITDATAPTEETTAPTTGNDTPGGAGGLGGSGGGSGNTEGPENKPVEPTEPVWEVSQPGTEKNPYIEAVAKLPATFTTVRIPSKGTVVYHLYGGAGAVITVSDTDAVIGCNGKTYKAENGVVSLPVAENVKEPVVLKFGNVSSEEKGFAVELTETPGKQSNPYQITLETLPAEVETPKIKAGQTVYYSISGAANATLTVADADATVVYGETTYAAQDGVVALQLSEEEPALLAVVNGGKETKAFTMQFGVVDDDNTPQVLEELGELTAVLTQGDATGNYYRWTATDTGLFTVEITGVTEGVVCELGVLNETTGERKLYSLDAKTHEITGITKLTIGVNAGDVIAMNVVAEPDAEENIPAAEVNLYTALEGTKDAPIQQFYPGFAEKIPAGMTLYFQSYRLNNITATVDGGDFTVVHADQTYQTAEGAVSFPAVCPDMFTPAVFAITNNGSEAAVCTVKFAFPVGNYDNPQVLETAELESFTVQTEEGNEQGYYLQWTAPANGNVSFRVLNIIPADSGYDVILTNSNNYSQPMLSESEDGTVSMDVAAGDVVTIHVAVMPDQYYNYPAATLTVEGTYSGEIPGTQETPYEVMLTELPASVEALGNIPAGQNVYYNVYGASDVCLTVESENAYVIYNGVTYGPDNTGKVVVNLAPAMGRFPTAFQLGNNGVEAQKFVMNFEALPGTGNNPEQITSWENGVTVNLGANDPDGIYYYSWIADEDGIFQVCVDSAPDGVAYNVVLTNNDSYAQATLAEDDVISDDITFVQIYVRKGEPVAMQLTVEGTYDPATGTMHYPEASFDLRGYVSGSSALDLTGETEGDPYYLSVEQCKLPVPGTGKVYLSAVCHGKTLTIENENAYVEFDGKTYEPDANGVISFTFPESQGVGRPMPLGFAVGNKGEYDGIFEISAVSPEGTYENPAKITDIQTVAVALEAGNEIGYYLTWTAEATGTLKFTVAQITEGVECDVLLSSTGSYSQPLLSESEDGTVAIEVAKGDVLTVLVSVIPDSQFRYPAADILLTGEFTAK